MVHHLKIVVAFCLFFAFSQIEARGGHGGGGGGGFGRGGEGFDRGGFNRESRGMENRNENLRRDEDLENAERWRNNNLDNDGDDGDDVEFAPEEQGYDVDTNPGDTDYGDSMIDGPQVDGNAGNVNNQYDFDED